MNKKNILISLSLLVIAAGLVVFSSLESKRPVDRSHVSLGIGDTVFFVEVADDDVKRQRGLSGREGLDDDKGMLFVFDREDDYSFWMKDMLFNIDIIWINEGKEIVHIEKNVSPDSYPKSFTPSAPALYVLEINAGLSDAIDIKIGDTINI